MTSEHRFNGSAKRGKSSSSSAQQQQKKHNNNKKIHKNHSKRNGKERGGGGGDARGIEKVVREAVEKVRTTQEKFEEDVYELKHKHEEELSQPVKCVRRGDENCEGEDQREKKSSKS